MFLLNFNLCPCADVIEYVIEQDIIVHFICFLLVAPLL